MRIVSKIHPKSECAAQHAADYSEIQIILRASLPRAAPERDGRAMIFYSYPSRVYGGKREGGNKRGKRKNPVGIKWVTKKEEWEGWKNAILRVYAGFPGPVQEFVRGRSIRF